MAEEKGYVREDALPRAQRDIDLRPERHTHYYKREFPDRFHARMDTRRWGSGEPIVCEPYAREGDCIARHEIFESGGMGSAGTKMRSFSALMCLPRNRGRWPAGPEGRSLTKDP
ncbi:MAG: hypothetical protein U1E60_29340 [Reyranellaceae bacterium]